jgi:hypothetical protein
MDENPYKASQVKVIAADNTRPPASPRVRLLVALLLGLIAGLAGIATVEWFGLTAKDWGGMVAMATSACIVVCVERLSRLARL